MSKFQIILLSVFGFFILLAVVMFALYRGGSVSEGATITVWGQLPHEDISQIIDIEIPNIDKNLVIRYVEKDEENIDKEFTEALATGRDPDLIILTQDRLWKNKSKLVPIPYGTLSEREFRETFVEEAELFLSAEGVYGLPFSVDPLVLYFNRDLLSGAAEANPIAYWDELYQLTQKLTKKDNAGNLTQSVLALGEARNIPNFKDILSLLFLQAGTSITTIINDELRMTLTESQGASVSPGEAALNFFTQFSNSAKAYYSWNRTMPPAETHFASGDSAYYLGFASELPLLRNKNPNLNLGVTTAPQSRVSGQKLTFGKLSAIAITRGTENPSAAYLAAQLLTSKNLAEKITKNTGLPPARRDLLSAKQAGSFLPVFYESALQSRGWRDPENDATSVIFLEMIESVTSGRARTEETLGTASRAIENLINK